MHAISKLRQARHPEQLAQEIEPLAQALATLADETREALKDQQQASREQAEQWSQAQTETAQAWETAAHTLNEAANNATNAVQGWTWRLWLSITLASLLPTLGLLIALWLWLDPRIVTEQGQTWLIMKLSG